MKPSVVKRLGIAAVVLLGASAAGWRLVGARPSVSPGGGDGSDGVEFERIDHAGTSFDVVWVDPARAEIAVFWKDAGGRPYRTLRGFGQAMTRAGRRVLAATNAGMFEEAPSPATGRLDSIPLGLHVESGAVLRPLNRRVVRPGEPGWGNFYMRPNAVFGVDRSGRAWVRETPRVAGGEASLAHATQSGPALVLEGKIHPGFARPGGRRQVRNAVGVCGRGRVALVYTGAATVHELADLFRARLGCPDAVYLDGSISGLLVPDERVRVEHGRYVGILAVLARRE